MYFTTLAATIVTARNLLVTIVPQGGAASIGAWAMVIISALLFVTALIIGWDGLQAYRRYQKPAQPEPAAAAAGD